MTATGEGSRCVRAATPADIPAILEFIRQLGVYEKLEHLVRTDDGRLHEHLFGDRPACEALIGELDGVPRGFALFFQSYSTFELMPCYWLEDLFVEEAARGRGLGKALLAELARLTVERGFPRLDWYVLEWNKPSIDFYHHLGARMLDDWRVCRLEGDALRNVAQS